MFDKADKTEVSNKTNISYTSLLEEARNNTPDCIISDEKTKMVDVISKGLNGQIMKETLEQKIISGPSLWYTGDINPVTGMRARVVCLFLGR